MSERIAPESVLAGALDEVGDLSDLQDPGLGQVQDPVQNTSEWMGQDMGDFDQAFSNLQVQMAPHVQNDGDAAFGGSYALPSSLLEEESSAVQPQQWNFPSQPAAAAPTAPDAAQGAALPVAGSPAALASAAMSGMGPFHGAEGNEFAAQASGPQPASAPMAGPPHGMPAFPAPFPGMPHQGGAPPAGYPPYMHPVMHPGMHPAMYAGMPPYAAGAQQPQQPYQPPYQQPYQYPQPQQQPLQQPSNLAAAISRATRGNVSTAAASRLTATKRMSMRELDKVTQDLTRGTRVTYGLDDDYYATVYRTAGRAAAGAGATDASAGGGGGQSMVASLGASAPSISIADALGELARSQEEKRLAKLKKRREDRRGRAKSKAEEAGEEEEEEGSGAAGKGGGRRQRRKQQQQQKGKGKGGKKGKKGKKGKGGADGSDDDEDVALLSEQELAAVRRLKTKERTDAFVNQHKVFGRHTRSSAYEPPRVLSQPGAAQDAAAAADAGAAPSSPGTSLLSDANAASLRDAELGLEAVIEMEVAEDRDRQGLSSSAHEAASQAATRKQRLARQLAFALGLVPTADGASVAVDAPRLLRLLRLAKGKRAAAKGLARLPQGHVEALLPVALRYLLFFVCTVSPRPEDSRHDAACADALCASLGTASPAVLLASLQAFLDAQTPMSLPSVLNYELSARVVETLLSTGQHKCAAASAEVSQGWIAAFDELKTMASAQ